jgi:hypothetical protein
MKKLLLTLLIPLALCAQAPHKSPEQINKELQAAEAEFARAKKLFNPWYTGPLVTPSATMVPPGMVMTQPYLFVNGNYQRFNSKRKAIDLPHNLYQVKGLSVFQIGLTNTSDFTITPSAAGQWENDQQGGGFGDLPITIGFLFLKQTLYVPQIKFTITETFPTGRYQHLSSNGLGLSGLGGGSYQTQFGVTFGKVILWNTLHPMNTRLFIGYNIATPVHVKGFNFQGGGFGTDGVVRQGNTFSADLGLELSINQPWVIALDLVYTAQNITKFHGNPGVDKEGKPAAVGGGYNDNFSLAPAIEYNFNDSLGIITGVQFSVYGRNSLNFASGQFSFYYFF